MNSFIESWKDVAVVLAGLWLSLLSWIGMREVKRVDNKADRDDVDRLIRLIERREEEDRQNRKALYEKIDSAIESQGKINRDLIAEVSRIVGRLNGKQ